MAIFRRRLQIIAPRCLAVNSIFENIYLQKCQPVVSYFPLQKVVLPQATEYVEQQLLYRESPVLGGSFFCSERIFSPLILKFYVFLVLLDSRLSSPARVGNG